MKLLDDIEDKMEEINRIVLVVVWVCMIFLLAATAIYGTYMLVSSIAEAIL